MGRIRQSFRRLCARPSISKAKGAGPIQISRVVLGQTWIGNGWPAADELTALIAYALEA